MGVRSLNLEIIDLGGESFKDQKKLHRSLHFHTHLSCAKAHVVGRAGTIVTHILTIENQRVSDSLGPQAPRQASLKSLLMALVISTVLGGSARPRGCSGFCPGAGAGGCHHGEFPTHAQPFTAGVPVAGARFLPLCE